MMFNRSRFSILKWFHCFQRQQKLKEEQSFPWGACSSECRAIVKRARARVERRQSEVSDIVGFIFGRTTAACWFSEEENCSDEELKMEEKLRATEVYLVIIARVTTGVRSVIIALWRASITCLETNPGFLLLWQPPCFLLPIVVLQLYSRPGVART